MIGRRTPNTYVCRGLGRLLGTKKILDIGHWDHQVAICCERRGGVLVYGPTDSLNDEDELGGYINGNILLAARFFFKKVGP